LRLTRLLLTQRQFCSSLLLRLSRLGQLWL
jgi:hypothetical protein